MSSDSRIRAVVVDDEPLAVRRLVDMLHDTRRVDVVGQSIDPVEAVSMISGAAPDVLFLDVQMPGLTGFEVLAQLERPPSVVFTTAHEQHAVRAFEVAAVDYLIKPITEDALGRALARVMPRSQLGSEHHREPPDPDASVQLERLLRQLEQPKYLRRLASRIGARVVLLDVAQVQYFEARDKLTWAIAPPNEHVVDLSLTELERRLDPDMFVRIHRRTLVNLDAVAELSGWTDEGVCVRLKDARGTELDVARDRVRMLKTRLGLVQRS